jgi:hypothetical protein
MLIMAEMTLRGLLRRRTSLALLVLLPLAFYAARHDQVGQSIRFLALGLAWAVSTVALFATLDARQTESRLCISGWSRRDLIGGRALALLGIALALALAYLALILADDRPVAHDAGVGLILVTTAIIAVALGSMLGVVAGRELEGALLLLIIAGLQFIADPPTTLAHALPFWSTRELGTHAIDGSQHGSLGAGLVHAAATLGLLGATTLTITLARLRRHPASTAAQHQ